MHRRSLKWFALAVVTAVVAGQGKEELASTVITSKRLTFDYKRSIAIFEGEVTVTDPRLRMTADEMRVIFDADQSVRSITALGNVRLSQKEKKASCHKAIYLAKAQTVDLIGEARVEQEGKVIMGEVISIRLDREEMICEPGHAIIAPAQSGTPLPALP